MPRRYNKSTKKTNKKRYNNNRMTLYRKPVGYMSRSNLRNNNLHAFKLKLWADGYIAHTVTALGSVPNGQTAAYGALSFALSNIPNHLEFTGMYDQYRICGIAIKFHPQYTEFNGQDINLAGSLDVAPVCIHMVSDFDDAVAPLSIDQVVTRGNSRSMYMDRVQKRYLVPRIYSTTNDTLGSNIFKVRHMGPRGNPWIDCTTPDAGHLGLKYAVTSQYKNTSGSNIDYRIRIPAVVTYYVQFKNVRQV